MNPLTTIGVVFARILLLGFLAAGRLSEGSAFAATSHDSTAEACFNFHDGTALPCVTVSPKGGRNSGALFPSAATPPPPSAIGVKRILLYRVDFSDFVGAAIASNTAAILISDLNNYYRDMSYGLMSFSAAEAGSVVTETLRLPEPSTAYDHNFNKFINATRQVAAERGYVAAEFDFDVICTGAKPAAFFGGIAYVGGPGLWIPNGNFNVGVLGHELGHNLGLPHASFWYTGDLSTVGPGILQQYGDLFDSMGVPGGSTSHFNTCFKQQLGWIPEAEAPFVTTNGTYRVTAHDHPSAAGRRALRLTRGDAWTYWLEFRQAFNNRWVTNGASLRCAGPNGTNTLLLDTTPGTPQASQDCPISIGRTFSDRCLDLHVTPIGKGGTSPESLDIVVNRGPFPGNVPPVVTLAASETNIGVGNSILLEAAATDVNGDALAYYWDFGDNIFGGNLPSVQHAWTAAGEFVVRCTVTDMKGGTASASVVVRVGTISTFLLSGRATRNGAPVEGVLVKAGSRFSYSDSDGNYRISRVTTGRQTVTAVYDGASVVNAGFENPVAVGPSAGGLDFIVVPESFSSIALVVTGSVWRYLDTGEVPQGNWTELTFDDTAWKSGRAKLGYGVGDEATSVGFGTNTLDRFITTWFRQRFVVEDTSLLNHLVLSLRRDDGAVVYLNGLEVYRENLPAGSVQASTTALVDVGSSEEMAFFKRYFPASRLVTGTNIVAVEIHQFRTNSIDLSFDFELQGVSENLDSFRPLLTVQKSDAAVLLRWPSGYNGWFVYDAANLSAGDAWSRSSSPLVRSNGWDTIGITPNAPARFFQLRRPGFCSPFE